MHERTLLANMLRVLFDKWNVLTDKDETNKQSYAYLKWKIELVCNELDLLDQNNIP